jgi:membrane protease YdiL (CAAX protease family)
MFQPYFADHLLFVLFGIIVPLNAVVRAQPVLKSIDSWDTRLKRSFYFSNAALLWVMAGAIVAVWLFSGRSPAGLGFRLPIPGAWPESLLIAAGFLLLYGFDVWRELSTAQARERMREDWRRHTPFLPETRSELRAFNFLAFSAAVGEEIVFLLSLFGPSGGAQWLALALSTGIFALSHFYQGWKAMGKIAALSLAFGLIFLLSGSLLLPIILHLIVDIAGGWIGYRVMREI